MFELILSVCLITDPKACKDVYLTYRGNNPTPYECMRKGQPEMAKWVFINRGWRVKKWRCGPVRSAKNI